MSADTQKGPTEPIPAKSMLIKTDKPRPYACATCTRAFARLEHLKRHERSHTKEKPFECPVCERSFARRDLLLRHKQKLHAAFSPDKDAPIPLKDISPARQDRKRRASIKRESPTITHSAAPHASSLKTNLGSIGGEDSSPPVGSCGSVSTLATDGLTPFGNIGFGSALTGAFGNLGATVTLGLESITPHTGESMNSQISSGIDIPSRFTSAQSQPQIHQHGKVPNQARWLPLNPLEHELGTLRSGIPPPQFRGVLTGVPRHPSDLDSTAGDDNGQSPLPVPNDLDHTAAFRSSRSSRANSFSASGATSYMPLKDLEKFAATNFTGASEVGFSTPQAYAAEGPEIPDYLDLDSGFVNPAVLGGSTLATRTFPPVHGQMQTRTQALKLSEFDLNDISSIDSPTYMAPVQDAQYWNSPMPIPNAGPAHASTPTPLTLANSAPPQSMTLGNRRTDPLFKEYVASQGDDFMSSLVDFEDRQIASTLDFGAIAPFGDSPTEYSEGAGSGMSSPSGAFTSFVMACFTKFTPHLPFVHPSAPLTPELEHAIAAIGAQTMNDSDSALRNYGRAKYLLGEANPLTLESVQAGILVAVFGLFHASEAENTQAIDRLRDLIHLSSELNLGEYDPKLNIAGQGSPAESSTDSWVQFVHTQSRMRTLYALHAVVSWTHALIPSQSAGLRVDLSNAEVPCDEARWRAMTAAEWISLGPSSGSSIGSPSEEAPPSFSQALATLTAGQQLSSPRPLPQLFLQALVLELLTSATTRRHSDAQALRAWESTWSRSQSASLDPRSVQGPIMADCVPLASLVAVRSAVDLSQLSACLWTRDYAAMNKEMDLARHVRNQGLMMAAPFALDVMSWADKHARDSSSFSPPTLVALTDGGFVLAEALAIISSRGVPATGEEQELVQRAIKLSGPFPGETLSCAILRTAARLVRFATWPLAGTLGAALEARRY